MAGALLDDTSPYDLSQDAASPMASDQIGSMLFGPLQSASNADSLNYSGGSAPVNPGSFGPTPSGWGSLADYGQSAASQGAIPGATAPAQPTSQPAVPPAGFDTDTGQEFPAGGFGDAGAQPGQSGAPGGAPAVPGQTSLDDLRNQLNAARQKALGIQPPVQKPLMNRFETALLGGGMLIAKALGVKPKEMAGFMQGYQTAKQINQQIDQQKAMQGYQQQVGQANLDIQNIQDKMTDAQKAQLLKEEALASFTQHAQDGKLLPSDVAGLKLTLAAIPGGQPLSDAEIQPLQDAAEANQKRLTDQLQPKAREAAFKMLWTGMQKSGNPIARTQNAATLKAMLSAHPELASSIGIDLSDEGQSQKFSDLLDQASELTPQEKAAIENANYKAGPQTQVETNRANLIGAQTQGQNLKNTALDLKNRFDTSTFDARVQDTLSKAAKDQTLSDEEKTKAQFLGKTLAAKLNDINQSALLKAQQAQTQAVTRAKTQAETQRIVAGKPTPDASAGLLAEKAKALGEKANADSILANGKLPDGTPLTDATRSIYQSYSDGVGQTIGAINDSIASAQQRAQASGARAQNVTRYTPLQLQHMYNGARNAKDAASMRLIQQQAQAAGITLK